MVPAAALQIGDEDHAPRRRSERVGRARERRAIRGAAVARLQTLEQPQYRRPVQRRPREYLRVIVEHEQAHGRAGRHPRNRVAGKRHRQRELAGRRHAEGSIECDDDGRCTRLRDGAGDIRTRKGKSKQQDGGNPQCEQQQFAQAPPARFLCRRPLEQTDGGKQHAHLRPASHEVQRYRQRRDQGAQQERGGEK